MKTFEIYRQAYAVYHADGKVAHNLLVSVIDDGGVTLFDLVATEIGDELTFEAPGFLSEQEIEDLATAVDDYLAT